MKLVILLLCMVQYVSGVCMIEGTYSNNYHITAAQVEAHLNSIGKTTIGDSLTSGYAPFYECARIKSIEIPAMVTSIGYAAFKKAGNLRTVDFSQATGLKHIGDSAFFEVDLHTLDLTGATALETIGYLAFKGESNPSLKSVKFGAALKTIGNAAFTSNWKLTSVDFSQAAALTSIGWNAFYHCKLTSVDFSGATSLTSIGWNAFYSYVDEPYTSIIFSKKPTIGNEAFHTKKYSTTYSPPAYTYCLRTPDSSGHVSAAALDGVTEIGSSSDYTGFYGCSALTSIEIPASVNTIHDRAFYNSGLTSITILGDSTISDATPISDGKQLTLTRDWVEVPVVSASALETTWSNMPCGVSGQVYQRGPGTCTYGLICFNDGTVLECPSGAVRLSTDQCSSRKSDLWAMVRPSRGIVCSVE